MSFDPDAFIDDAIHRGQTGGISSLSGVARWIYLISEAEVRCDKDGIDSFVDAHGEEGIAQLATAYAAIGAASIASSLMNLLRQMPNPSDAALNDASARITERDGYSYEDLVKAVVRGLS